MNRRSVVVALLLTMAPSGAATVEEIVAGNRKVLNGIQDFTCLMTFNIRSVSVRVPDTRVKIYFKKPDRFKPEAVDGDFTVLPKTYHMSIGNVLERLVADCDAVVLPDETLDGRPQYRLKLVPKEPGTGVKYHLVHVDQEHYTVSRIRTYPEGEQPVTMELDHKAFQKGHLPVRARITGYHRSPDGEGLEQVRVTITFTRYRVNVGLSDQVFEEQGGSN